VFCYTIWAMSILNRKEPVILFIGDLLFFSVALWLSLYLRYFEVPGQALLDAHIVPFSVLFVVWVITFFIAGLYEKQTVILKSRLPAIIFNTQIANSIIAVLFFYFIPYFGITPKTNLFIDLFFSFVLIVAWRLYIYPRIGTKKKQNAILIGSGKEMAELRNEVNNNSQYGLNFISSIDLNDADAINFQEDILNRIYSEEVSIVAIDLRNQQAEPLLPHLYNLIFSNIIFIDKHKIYEDIFDRIPLSLVKYSWFLENISTSPNVVYDFLKRVMDICFALIIGVVYLIFLPFVYIAIKLNDGGPVHFFQDRVGKNNVVVRIMKFRTMNAIDDGTWVTREGEKDKREMRVTRVGKFLRKARIDEFPQFWNLLKGDISFIGPRPELPALVKFYEQEIPYYNVRHLIRPGLSGWAQIHHEVPPHTVEETRTKLSYDLYYIKNRSFLLDIKIALRTIKTLLSRSGI
jgi:exopolysaccharide biosynthesis polyprenyl glycosylphosphotransferase